MKEEGQLSGQHSQIRWAWFLLGSLMTLLTSIGMGFGLYLAYQGELHVALFTPLVLLLPVVGLIYGTVRQSCCRSALAAGLLGGVAGTLFYLSYYHWDMLHEIGLDKAPRVDLLPHFVKQRLATQEWWEGGKFRWAQPQPPNPNPGLIQGMVNGLVFALEWLFVAGAGVGAGVMWARRPFCEQTGRWQTEEVIPLLPGTGSSLVQALSEGRLGEWGREPPKRVEAKPPYGQVTIRHAPRQAEDLELPPVHLSVAEWDARGKSSAVLPDRVLQEEEIKALKAALPILEGWAGTAGRKSPAPTPREASTATIWPVPSPYSGTVLTLRTKLIENGALLLQFLVLGLVCFVPLPIGISIADGLMANQPNLSVIPVLVGLVLSFVLVFWLFIGQLIKNPWSSRYLYYKARKEFRQRPDPLVDPNNPDAILVQVIPRENWTRVMLEDSADLGFLFIDRERRQLLFEGDKERYRIPAQALLSCGVELMNKNAETNHQAVPIQLTLVSVREGDRVREIPLRPLRTVSGESLGANYVERAIEMERRILSLPVE